MHRVGESPTGPPSEAPGSKDLAERFGEVGHRPDRVGGRVYVHGDAPGVPGDTHSGVGPPDHARVVTATRQLEVGSIDHATETGGFDLGAGTAQKNHKNP